MVACGSVFDVRKVNGMGFAVEGYVAAEKTSNKFYRTTVDVVDRRHVGTCTCIARSNTHRCCKHQVCLLLVLLLIRDRVPPKWCRRVGVNRFTDPNNPTFKAARLGLTFNELLGQLQTPATHYSGKKANLVNEVWLILLVCAVIVTFLHYSRECPQTGRRSSASASVLISKLDQV